MTRTVRVLLVLLLGVALALPLAFISPARATAAPAHLQVERTLGFGRQNAVSCTSTRFCMVVGDDGHAAVVQNGVLTGRMTFPLVDENLFFYGPVGLSCVSATFCAAVGNELATTFDGRRWSAPTPVARLGEPDIGVPPSMSCTAPTFCMAVSGEGTWAVWRGSGWQTRANGPDIPSLATAGPYLEHGVSCSGAFFCVAAVRFAYEELGTAADLWSWNGTTWSEVPGHPSNGGTSTLVSCPTTSFCRAVEAGVVRTWNGSSWTDAPLPSGDNSYLLSLRCFADRQCIGATQRYLGAPRAELNRIVGTSWPVLATISGDIPRATQPVDCWAAAGCELTYTDNTSQQWTAGTGFGAPYRLGDRLYDAVDVSCAATAFCGAVNARGEFGTLREGTWSRAVAVGGGVDARAVSCTPARCVVVTDRGVAVRISPDGTASAQQQIDTAGLTAISCAGNRICIAVDTLGRVVRYEDGAWHTPTQRSPDGVLRSVSCVSGRFCMAAGHGYVITYRGAGRWTPATRIGDYAGPVSCTSATNCVLGAKTAFVRWDGRTFAAPVPVIHGGTLVTHISCTDASRCVLDLPHSHVALDGDAQEGSYLPDGITSCWTPTHCLLVSDADHAYVVAAPDPGR